MSKLLNRSLAALIVQCAGQASSIVVGIALARELGPAGKGTIAYATIGLAMVLTFFNGQSEAISYQFGSRRLSFLAVYRATLRIFFLVSPIFMAGMIALAFWNSGQRGLVAAAVALPFALYAQLATQFFLMIGRQSIANIQWLLTTLLYAVLVIPLLIWGHIGTTVALLVWVFSIACGSIIAILNLRPYFTGTMVASRDSVASDTDELLPEREIANSAVRREQLVFMGKAGLSSFASYLNLRIDVIIISLMLGPAELGIYTLAIATGELMWKVSQAVTWSALGRIATETPERSADLVAKITRNMFAPQLIFGILIFLFAPPLIVMVYGPAFSDTATALRILLPGLVFYPSENAISYFFSVQKGKPNFRLAVQAFSICMCAIVTITTIHRFSIMSAALATSISYCCVVAVMTVLFTKSTGINVWQMYVLQPDDFLRYRRLISSLKVRASAIFLSR